VSRSFARQPGEQLAHAVADVGADQRDVALGPPSSLGRACRIDAVDGSPYRVGMPGRRPAGGHRQDQLLDSPCILRRQARGPLGEHARFGPRQFAAGQGGQRVWVSRRQRRRGRDQAISRAGAESQRGGELG
jgi:hypothetical protein